LSRHLLYLSVTTWTIRRLIDNKELSCAKIGKEDAPGLVET